MTTWQADFYRRPLKDQAGNVLWELVVCDLAGEFSSYAFCQQSAADSLWLGQQLQQMAHQTGGLPQRIQVFRPQSISLLTAACQPLGVVVEPTRRTPALKQLLQQRADDYRHMDDYTHQPYEPIALEQPPPVPLPEQLWGKQWRFAAIAAADLAATVQNRPIPIVSMPDALLPVNLQMASTTMIPGVVVDGGRQSMRLARWLQAQTPDALKYIAGEPDGLILEAGLIDRWVLATFDDEEVIAAARTYQTRLLASRGLHFLLIQPDDSGMTYTGFWLLQTALES